MRIKVLAIAVLLSGCAHRPAVVRAPIPACATAPYPNVPPCPDGYFPKRP